MKFMDGAENCAQTHKIEPIKSLCKETNQITALLHNSKHQQNFPQLVLPSSDEL
jgi:hypothetical protein